jgi:hypothetical protein
MLRFVVTIVALLLATSHMLAAERSLDFGRYPLNETPPGFRSTVSGKGQPGNWKIILDEAPPLVSATNSPAPATPKRPVLAQVSGDMTDEHFPLLIFEEETFGDFVVTTHFKIVSGVAEQMAGLAFRYQDEKNYYYVRASSLGNTFRFFKVVEGQRSAPIGPEVRIEKGVWHELKIDCKGSQIRCALNGKELIPTLTDTSFNSGKIGFWTKSDSISYFADTRINYTPRETLASLLVQEAVKEFPRVVGAKIFAAGRNRPDPSIIASKDQREIGTPADSAARDVIRQDSVYFGKGKETVSVTLPLHDRNGDTVAAVRIVMKSFIGQTEQNAIARALPIVKRMELRVQSSKDLLE